MYQFALSKKISTLFPVLLGTAALLLSGNGSATDARLGHSFTEQHPRGLAMQKFADDVATATNGQIKIRVYPNSTLGSEEKMLQSVQGGVQEFYMGAVVPFSSRLKELQIFDFPFLFTDEREVAQVLDGPIGLKILSDMSGTGATGLVWAGGAFRNIANSRRAINKFEDLKGLKIRVMQSPIWLETFRAMGINAMPMAYTEVFPAMETRALDGLEHPPVDMFQNKIYEVAKYLALTHHGYTPVALVVSSKWLDALPADQQAAVRQAAEDARDFQRAEEARQEKTAVDSLRESGMTVTQPAPEEIEKMRAAIRPVLDKFAADIGPDFVKSFYAEIDKARKANQ